MYESSKIKHGTKCLYLAIHLLCFGRTFFTDLFQPKRRLLNGLQKVIGIVYDKIQIIPSTVQCSPGGTCIKATYIRPWVLTVLFLKEDISTSVFVLNPLARLLP